MFTAHWNAVCTWLKGTEKTWERKSALSRNWRTFIHHIYVTFMTALIKGTFPLKQPWGVHSGVPTRLREVGEVQTNSLIKGFNPLAWCHISDLLHLSLLHLSLDAALAAAIYIAELFPDIYYQERINLRQYRMCHLIISLNICYVSPRKQVLTPNFPSNPKWRAK